MLSTLPRRYLKQILVCATNCMGARLKSELWLNKFPAEIGKKEPSLKNIGTGVRYLFLRKFFPETVSVASVISPVLRPPR